MTQRIFDMDNPQDVKDLFNILPNKVTTIVKDAFDNEEIKLYDKNNAYIDFCSCIRVNWRNKKEITRPVDDSKWIGCLCCFVGDDGTEYIGILHAIRNGDDSYPYVCRSGILRAFKYCRPVRRNEIKFVEDVE